MTRKVALFVRDSFDARVIANYIYGNDIQIVKIVLETGSIAKKKKLNRILKNKSYNLLFKLTWIAFLLLYTNYYYFRMKSNLKRCNAYKKCLIDYPNVSTLIVDDINELTSLETESDVKVDTILVLGTSILSHETIARFEGVNLLNIHTGCLPEYRNVHSDFWSLYNKDWDKVGVTIFKINSGIDTGDIVKIANNNKAEEQTLSEIKAENLKLSCLLALELCNHNGEYKLYPQDKSLGTSYPSPNHYNYIELIRRIGLRKVI